MLLQNVKLKGFDNNVDIRIIDGKFSEISENLLPSQGEEVIDGKGYMALPPYVDSHCHLDYVGTCGQPVFNMSGTLFEGIDIWAERKKSISREDIIERASKVIKWQVANGTQHIRTHVNVDEPGLVSMATLLELREKFRDLADIQIVAFPQHGVLNYENALELTEEALKMGADVVGAIPHFEDTREDSVESLKKIFDLAERYNVLVDVHCDETDDEQSRCVEVVAAEAFKRGLGSRVTASHTTAMHSYNNAYCYKLFGVLKKSGINFVTNPPINTHLQGRYDSYPMRRGITRIRELTEEGMNVSMGTDDIMDPFYPLGAGDMLEVLQMGIHVGHLTGYSQLINALDYITCNGAKTLNIADGYGIEVGKDASLNLIPADDAYDLIRRSVKPCMSIRKGKVIASKATEVVTLSRGENKEYVDFRL